jgi:5-(carboxyamino)imidazole ribonucleotide synthase
MTRIAPGETIGILGGGQLGRMLSVAAARLGFDVHVFTDEADSPAGRVSAKTISADFLDRAALAEFARGVAVVTTEFENVPADTARTLQETGVVVRPAPEALAIAQDRFDEKSFFRSIGVATPPFAAIDRDEDIARALDEIGAPAILKTRRLGYDGRGQVRVASRADAEGAFKRIGGQPGILEGFCAFEREISIIAARSETGEIACYDLCENVHDHGILTRTRAPARVGDAVRDVAQRAAQRVLEHFGYVGVLAIEFFLMKDGALIANEMAPRVHNSGHWTIEAARTSQFEQHIRAVAGWPLGSTERICDAEMINLIGEDAGAWESIAADPEARLHLYGKRDARRGRKMGHVTRLWERIRP